tara:strand:+ start:1439 stop:1882 length:444 start_codon:yes stop_codon:yes gene_type:complete
MSLAAKDFLFQLQLLVARTGSDRSLRESMLADARSTLIANGLIPPAGLKFNAHENTNKAAVEENEGLISIALPEFLQPDSTADFLTPKEMCPIRDAIVEAVVVSVMSGTGGEEEPQPEDVPLEVEVCVVETEVDVATAITSAATISG